ncbi:MAG: transporter [Hyphomicrobium sp.]
MAGFVPPPGTYLQSDHYFYAGDAGANLQLPLGANLAVGVEAEAAYGINTGLWVVPEKILGANLGLGVSIVTGWKNVEASATIGPFGANIQDDRLDFGDPVLSAMLGWHYGNWHTNIYTMINTPIGQWERGNLANIGFNRWAIDTGGALTYLDQANGHELSAAMGFTHNFENPDTDYKSGTEFHIEAALVQHVSKELAVGIVGYYYDQISGDSGAGARLGDFEGRVAAVGPMISYTFMSGGVPISTSLRYFKEFDATNRLEGESGLFTIAMPLSGGGH